MLEAVPLYTHDADSPSFMEFKIVHYYFQIYMLQDVLVP